jgi:RNA polymerase sigma-70 factor, ECF subfamily
MKEQSSTSEIHGAGDEALMGRAARGERDAFAELVRRHQNPLVNYFRRLGDSTHAEDLAQETFIRLYRYREKYRPTAKFTTFLYTLARRARIDDLRKRARRADAMQRYAEDRDVREASAAAPGSDREQRAVEALNQLSETMRETVLLSVFQGFTYREIADITGAPEGTIKTRMYHAMRKLRVLLEENEDEAANG